MRGVWMCENIECIVHWMCENIPIFEWMCLYIEYVRSLNVQWYWMCYIEYNLKFHLTIMAIKQRMDFLGFSAINAKIWSLFRQCTIKEIEEDVNKTNSKTIKQPSEITWSLRLKENRSMFILTVIAKTQANVKRRV